MMRPTFLVIGAAKAGTSALFDFLAQHPDVFASPVKEPNFFAFAGGRASFTGPGDQEIVRRTISDRHRYLELFDGVRFESAIGEASAFYLYWEGAPANIARWLPEARLVVVLRDPASRAFSSYRHLVRDGHETLSFEAGLAEEPTRIAAGWQPLWHYRAAGRYVEQLERYFALFRREQILVHLYDDFVKDPLSVVARTYDFIGVDPEFRPNLAKRLNPSGRPRSATLRGVLQRESLLKRCARNLLPQRMRTGLWRALTRVNTRPTHETMWGETRRMLEADFAAEIDRLEGLLGRDLSAWRS